MEDLKKLSIGPTVKSTLEAVAYRQVKAFAVPYTGLTYFDKEFMDKAIQLMSLPLKDLYCGIFCGKIDKTFNKGFANKTAELAGSIANAERLKLHYFQGNEFDNLAGFLEDDVNRVKAVFAGLSQPDDGLTWQLVQLRAEAFCCAYYDIIKSQVELVFSKNAMPVSTPSVMENDISATSNTRTNSSTVETTSESTKLAEVEDTDSMTADNDRTSAKPAETAKSASASNKRLL